MQIAALSLGTLYWMIVRLKTSEFLENSEVYLFTREFPVFGTICKKAQKAEL